jgi:hypothetical protein
VEYDERGLFWIRNFLKYNSPDNPSAVTGWRNFASWIPECPLLSRAIPAIREHCSQRGNVYVENFDSGFGACFGHYLGNVAEHGDGQGDGHSAEEDVGHGDDHNEHEKEYEDEREAEVTPPSLLGADRCISDAPSATRADVDTTKSVSNGAGYQEKTSKARKTRKDGKGEAFERFVEDALKLNWYDAPQDLVVKWLEIRFNGGKSGCWQETVDGIKRQAAKNGKSITEAIQTCVALHVANYVAEYDKPRQGQTQESSSTHQLTVEAWNNKQTMQKLMGMQLEKPPEYLRAELAAMMGDASAASSESE